VIFEFVRQSGSKTFRVERLLFARCEAASGADSEPKSVLQNVTSEVEKATEAYELWAKSYPRDFVPHGNLGALYANLGQYDKAIAETETAQRLEPTRTGYGNLASNYINVNRLKDARQTIQEAQQKNFDDFLLRSDLYSLAFLSGDTAEMERDVAWAAGRPNQEDQMLNIHADTQAYYGRLGKARDLARRASDSAVRSDAKETGAQWLVYQGLREAELGNVAAARQGVARALALAPGRDVKVLSALALARSGETAQSKTILEALQTSEPTNTYLKVYWFPVIEASIVNGWAKPKWGQHTLEQVRTMAVEQWLRDVTLAPKSKLHLRNVLHVLFEVAAQPGATCKIGSRG
jgi:tetratricopeptide (TPR) repeat protein